MSSLFESASALGLPLEVPLRGRVLLLAPPDTLEVVARCEARLVLEAHRRLAACRWLDQEERQSQQERLDAAVAGGAYAYGSPHYAACMRQPGHHRFLVWAMLRVYRPRCREALAGALLDDRAALAELALHLRRAGEGPAPGKGEEEGGGCWTVKEIAAHLMGEPWCWPPDVVRRVTVSQWAEVVNHPRDGKGNLERASEMRGYVPPQDARTAVYRYWQARCLPAHLIEAKWRQWVAGRADLNPGGLRDGELIGAPKG